MRAQRIVTLRIDMELLEELDSLARLLGVSRSEVIRRAIEIYLRLETPKFSGEPKRVKLLS